MKIINYFIVMLIMGSFLLAQIPPRSERVQKAKEVREIVFGKKAPADILQLSKKSDSQRKLITGITVNSSFAPETLVTDVQYLTGSHISSIVEKVKTEGGSYDTNATFFAYDENMRVIEEIQKTKDNSGVLQNSVREEISYNELGFTEVRTTQRWIEGAWVNETRTEFIYAGIDPTGSISMRWLDEQWIYTDKTDITYADNTITYLNQYYLDNAWTNQNKNIHYYDEMGRSSQYEVFQWDAGEWMQTLRINQYYTDDNWEPDSTIQKFMGWSDWQTKSIYYYNENRDLVEEIVQNFYAEEPGLRKSSGWFNDMRMLFSYDDRRNNTEMTYFFWSASEENPDGFWDASSRDTWVYDLDNDMTELHSYYYDYELSGWIPGCKHFSIMDGYNNYFWASGHSAYINYKGYVSAEELNPDKLSFSLDQNYPNPFNPATVIKFAIPADGKVKLNVYNILGQQVATLVNEFKTRGSYEVKFDASGLGSGMYIYKLESGNFSDSKRMMLVK